MAGFASGEGNPAADVSGLSLSRDQFGTDTNDNATDFSASTPTPGVGPSPSVVPIPAALPLLLTGLAGLGLIGWRKRKAV